MKLFGLVLVAAMALCVALHEPAMADKLSDAIQQAVEAGKVDPSQPAGFLGIPGGPVIDWWKGLLWAIWVGWIFSTVGAFGGVMAAIGHMTVFGFGGYAKSFGKDLQLNKIVTDSIRTSNQYLVGTSAGISTFNYWKMGRLVLPLGLALGVGTIISSYLVPVLTAGKINLSSYQGYFGLFVLMLGLYLVYEVTPAGKAKKKAASAAAKAFQESVKKGGDLKDQGVKITTFSATKCVFTFFGVEFQFNPIVPVIGAFVIGAIASFLGVGGGFLLVPFLTSMAGLPMYLVAGTSAMGVFVGMITSIFSYMMQGTPIEWHFIGAEMVGIVIGSIVGPRTSKYLPDTALKVLFIILAFYTGVDYILRGFFGMKLL
ncbi:sulfite exporter TauE/SafE family protein [Megalodesulfovibrio paquesii]